MTTIDEQIAAVRRARVDYADRAESSTVPDNQRHWTAQAATLNSVLATLEQHKLALAVVEAARVAHSRYGLAIPKIIADAVAAFDAGEKPDV